VNRYNLGLFNSGTYTPTIEEIENISQSNPALITTAVDHTYVVNQQVQFFMPPQCGMIQLDKMKGYILDIPTADTFTVNIDTSHFDAFVTPTPPAFVVIETPQVAGIGDANYGELAPGGVLPTPQQIPGNFINHPPT
jgi:hypothetical protein